jgi:hypothetical protein
VTEESQETAAVEYRIRGGLWGSIALACLFVAVLVVGAFSGNPVFIAVAVLVSAAVWFYVLVLVSYEGELSPDGAVELRGVLRTQHTTVGAVRCISVTRGESRAMAFKIAFEGGTTRIGHRAGRSFVRALLERNPAIETRGRSSDF